MRLICLVAIVLFSTGFFVSVGAQEPDFGMTEEKSEKAQEELRGLKEQLKAQRKPIERLQDQIDAASIGQDPVSSGNGGILSAISSMNPKISLDGLFAGAGSTASDLENIETGGHDPDQRGFTVQNVELTLGAAVDPYFSGNANIVYQIDRQGESFVELEEAYLTTTSLPWNLQLKGGQFFSQFGRLNPTHPHAWDFADQPLVSGRFLGPDGLRGPGLQISYLLPVPIYAEAIAAIQNGSGETGFSFRNSPGEDLFGRPIVDRPIKGVEDMVIVPRLVGSVDLSDTQTVVMGLSGAFGANGSGTDTRTAIYGVDLFYKWKPLTAESGWPFVGWQTEAMARRYEAGAVDDPSAPLPEEILRDRGGYTQLIWGFVRRWVGGIRFDYVAGTGGDPASDPLRERRFRISSDVTFYPSEFSKWRLQYNWDDIQSRSKPVHSVFLQFEYLIGEHGAHKF
jgi:hypothetical protein